MSEIERKDNPTPFGRPFVGEVMQIVRIPDREPGVVDEMTGKGDYVYSVLIWEKAVIEK